jgi:hypothetical protein
MSFIMIPGDLEQYLEKYLFGEIKHSSKEGHVQDV